MSVPRAVRIPRARPGPALEPRRATEAPAAPVPSEPTVYRTNTGGTQRVVRLAVLFLVVLAAMYAAFMLYERTAPGGTASAAGNGILVFSGIFAAFAVLGGIYTLTAAPRAVEIESNQVTVVGRWGHRRKYPSLERVSVRVVRRYPEGLLASVPVDLIEVSGEGRPVRSYLVESGLFAGAAGWRGSPE